MALTQETQDKITAQLISFSFAISVITTDIDYIANTTKFQDLMDAFDKTKADVLEMINEEDESF